MNNKFGFRSRANSTFIRLWIASALVASLRKKCEEQEEEEQDRTIVEADHAGFFHHYYISKIRLRCTVVTFFISTFLRPFVFYVVILSS